MHRRGAHSLGALGSSSSSRTWSAKNTPVKQGGYVREPRSLDPKELRDMRKITGKIVNKTSPDSQSGWKHSTWATRAEEKRLVAAAGTGPAEQSQFVSESLSKYQAGSHTEDADGAEEDLADPNEAFVPGTFVEVRRNNISIHAVVLDEVYTFRSWRYLSMSTIGETWAHKKSDIMFTIPSFIPPDLASRCGASDLQTSKKSLMARAEVLKRLRSLGKEVEELLATVGRSKNYIYDNVKSEDPDRWSKVTLAEATHMVRPRTGSEITTLFATHKYLMDVSTYFIAEPTHYRISQTFDVRPQSHVDKLKAVTAMTRLQTGPLDEFVQMARSIIDRNRGRAVRTRQDPPLTLGEPRSLSPEFTNIIDVLLHSLRPTRSSQPNPYEIVLPVILKRLGYQTDLLEGAVAELLRDLGVLAPWQDVVDLISAPIHDPVISPAMEKAVVKNYVTRPTAGRDTPLGPEDFYSRDLAESIRHDFGDLPVYVIDDATAQELDDGVSIEQISSEPGSVWLHVHVADPSTILPPTNVLAQAAREKIGTRYFAHRTESMLPRELVRDRLSMGQASAAGRPERVMTFSAKIDREGNIVDEVVRAGIVRNVCTLTYDDVDQSMGMWAPQGEYPFGGGVQPPFKGLDPAHVLDMIALRELAQRLFAHRLRTTDTFSFETSKASVSFESGYPPVPPIDSSLRSFSGFPKLSYMITSSKNWGGSRETVSECMKIAGRVASRFCRDRGIPVIRRTLNRLTTKDESNFGVLLAQRDEKGYVPSSECIRLDIIPGTTEYTVKTGMHWGIAIPEGEGYCRVTSPLRRYTDLMAHWQIKHHLVNPTAPPLFPADSLEAAAKVFLRKEKSAQTLENRHNIFWVYTFLERWKNRATEEREENYLSGLEGTIMNAPHMNVTTRAMHCRIHVPSLGIDGLLNAGTSKTVLEPGSTVKVNVTKIHLHGIPQLWFELSS